jgi:hypothetical protein
MILEVLCFSYTQYIYAEQLAKSSIPTTIKTMIISIHQNFLLFLQLISTKLPAETTKNVLFHVGMDPLPPGNY